eukprot:TRINITY_DN0_c809_g1_i4.p1 TRINITY_DN0_c809_g1~~TRINITY_DN0_c809_g1_i4.p1  ORF type:complete len:180 (+),score=15.66 TRINITY_DN0_c809_g1_i4:48-587(+)
MRSRTLTLALLLFFAATALAHWHNIDDPKLGETELVQRRRCHIFSHEDSDDNDDWGFDDESFHRQHRIRVRRGCGRHGSRSHSVRVSFGPCGEVHTPCHCRRSSNYHADHCCQPRRTCWQDFPNQAPNCRRTWHQGNTMSHHPDLEPKPWSRCPRRPTCHSCHKKRHCHHLDIDPLDFD